MALKRITFSADEHLIDAARERARREHTTLNEEFCRRLAEYAERDERVRRHDEIVAALRGKPVVGRKRTRDEMNER